jgi:thiamine-phosphate pyrophosphorylase
MAETQIYLYTPDRIAELDRFAADLAAVLDAAPVACVLLRPESLADDDAAGDDAALVRAVRLLRPVVQDRGVAFLLDGRPELAAAEGCDGVHTCPAGPDYRTCRAAVGPNAIVGVSVRDSRHDAMVLGEAGADYVAFGRTVETPEQAEATREHCRWWAMLMEVPVVALGPVAPDTAALYAETGAEFVAAGPGIWDHPAGPAAGARALAEALAAA